jgi:DNA-directed RNA polymerase subunit RPC12/RpoP
MGDETHECANCGSKWQMVENTDVGGPNVCPVCMADDWNKPHHYD